MVKLTRRGTEIYDVWKNFTGRGRKTLAKALKFSLEKEGFKVDVAYDGEEALQALAGVIRILLFLT